MIAILFSQAERSDQFLESNNGNISVKLFRICTSGSNISYIEIWKPFSSTEQNYLCNFGTRYHGEYFCQIILNLDQ